ncbi:MAG: Crp/Fnr family transcriptional regulator [Rhodobacteraceae bacterium]|nr:MAG: Crp/Fnr family transcriptional regulator [Paracoccaceae bacterium]
MKPQVDLVPPPGDRHDPSLIECFLRVQPKAQIDSARKGRTLIQEDDFADHSMLLLEGWIAFSKMLPEGETQIIDVMLPGDFALIGAANAPVAACSVEALSDARFINIRPAHANGPRPDMARLRELMAAEIVRTQSRTSELLLRMGRGNAANRLAYALLEFYVRLEAIGLTRGGRFTFPMTQQKLGEFTGLSNVHVCRTLRRFEREGLIAWPTPTEIDLRDLDALCERSGIDLTVFRNEILARRTP